MLINVSFGNAAFRCIIQSNALYIGNFGLVVGQPIIVGNVSFSLKQTRRFITASMIARHV